MANTGLQPLTESGILTAIIVVMSLIGFYMPVLGGLFLMAWPLPMIVLIVRHGMRWGIMAAVLASLITALLTGPATATWMLVLYAPAGISLGIGYHRGWSIGKAFSLTAILSIAAMFLSFALTSAIAEMDFLGMVNGMVEEIFGGLRSAYSDTGIEANAEDLERAKELTLLLLPSLPVLLGLLISGMNCLLAHWLLRRIGHAVPSLPPFAEWRLPQGLALLFGFSLVGMYWGGSREIGWLYQASLNGNLLSTIAGMVQGTSLLWYVAERFRLHKWLRGILLVLFLLNGILSQLLAFTGLFDMVFDYRRRFGRRGNGGRMG